MHVYLDRANARLAEAKAHLAQGNVAKAMEAVHASKDPLNWANKNIEKMAAAQQERAAKASMTTKKELERAKRKAQALETVAKDLDKKAAQMPPTLKQEAENLHRMADVIRAMAARVGSY